MDSWTWETPQQALAGGSDSELRAFGELIELNRQARDNSLGFDAFDSAWSRFAFEDTRAPEHSDGLFGWDSPNPLDAQGEWGAFDGFEMPLGVDSRHPFGGGGFDASKWS